MKASPKILIVMAGFYRGSLIPAVTQVWVESLAVHAHQLVLVFDNPLPDQMPTQWEGHGIDALFEPHGEYDFGSYKRGLMHARAQGIWIR